MANIKPVPKVQAAGYAGGAALVLTWLLAQFGVHMPQEVALPAVVLLVLAAGWLMPGEGRRRKVDRSD